MPNISVEQKQALVDFWQARPHLAVLGSSTALTPKVVALWKELELILNNCDGDKKTWKEWNKVWKVWRRKIERKMNSHRKPLPHIETILVSYMFEPGGEHDKEKKDFITLEQKRKMIEFWNSYPDKKSIIRGNDAIRKRWQELAVILNNCEGKKKTWREWCVAWSDIKYRMRRKKRVQNSNAADERKKRSKAAQEQQVVKVMSEAAAAAGDDTFEGLENETLRRKTASTTYTQKCLMLDFWSRNTCYTGVGLGYEDYIKHWEELTEILNRDVTDGPQRPRKEWCKVWSDFKCQMKRKLMNREPETSFERKFAEFLSNNDGEDWRLTFNKRCTVEPDPHEKDDVVLLEPDFVTADHHNRLQNAERKTDAQIWREQRYRMLEFWKHNPDYFINRPGLGRKYLKQRRKLWEKLTGILNFYGGPQKTRQEWIQTWNSQATRVRMKLSKQLELSEFEAQFANVMAKCEADSYNCRIRLAKELKEIEEIDERNDPNAVFERLDKKYNIGSKNDRLKERRRLRRIKAYQPIVFKITSHDQKEKLLEFWENHLWQNNGSVVSKKNDIQKLWLQVTDIMHSCEGPQRTWKEWSSLWSSLKVAVRRKIFNQTEITGDFDKRLAEYIRKSENFTQKDHTQLSFTSDSGTQENIWQNVHEPKIELNTEPNYGRLVMKMGPELKVEFENDKSDCGRPKSFHFEAFNGSPNILEADIALKQRSLRMYQKKLLVQEKILVAREELVRVVKDGIQLVVDIVSDTVRENVSNIKNESSDCLKLQNTSKKIDENEFDLFAKHIAMQLRLLPRNISSETQEKILQVLEARQETVEVAEPEEVYIIQVMDDKWDSDVPWVQQDTIIDN